MWNGLKRVFKNSNISTTQIFAEEVAEAIAKISDATAEIYAEEMAEAIAKRHAPPSTNYALYVNSIEKRENNKKLQRIKNKKNKDKPFNSIQNKVCWIDSKFYGDK